ncbi:Calcineurin-like phosphoesterase [Neorhodopirellula lusitana]|uniref:Calcineurin-like phosphoesterase n=1 Tax=Neorhodopirellula lusitana TaxID=445327 RepID=A0ABY1Q9F2_9BACT|nr:metallophosphoesterase [Neorhodopirellula lusitana]SMP64121.1 Calcineurin-like phosphoesterase [Neorhodopirellula lusitana]
MTTQSTTLEVPKDVTPRYHGRKWIEVNLPETACDWSHGGDKSITTDNGDINTLVETLRDLNQNDSWKWPKRKHYFLSDLHADADALAASLVASGGVRQLGPSPHDFELTKAGRKSVFVIGGDCFDKGPSNLELLRGVRHLKDQGARLRILAGNHDIRLLFGMRVVGENKDVRNEHFFVRAGQKIMPLLKEIVDTYLTPKKMSSIPDAKTCRARLFPRESWFEEFPKIQGGDIVPAQVDRELNRIAKKVENFERHCTDHGLDLRQVYAATRQWKRLFLKREGEFRWFYRNLRLCYRSGSFLFVHAGVDDAVTKMLLKQGIGHINEQFHVAMKEAPFDFYYGSLCNTIRTKYRDVDRPFTRKGARNVHRAGITAILHGHRNLHHGQRLSLRHSQINFECDTSLDRHTRRVENVNGRGASVTIIDPSGRILGVSSDFPQVKVFEPQQTLKALINGTQAKPKR